MMRRWIRIALASAVMALAMGATKTAQAQVVVLTARSAGVLLNDAKALLTGAAPDPAMAQPYVDMIEGFKAPGALKGVDLTKPLGAYVDFAKDPATPPSIVVFVPVTDYAGFLQMLQGFGVNVEAKADAPGFTHMITPPGNMAPPLFAANSSGYALFTTNPAGGNALKALRPATLLPRRAGAGDLALTVNVDRIPDALKQQVLAQSQRLNAINKQRKPEETDANYKARVAGITATEDGFNALLRDGRELSLDVTVEPKKMEAVIELGMAAKPGSATAGIFKKLGAMKSKFRGLAAGAPFSISAALPIGETVRAAITKNLEQSRAEDEKKAANDEQRALANKIMDALKPTLTADSLDLGMAIVGPFPGKSGAPATMAPTGAIAVKGGKKLEAAILDAIKAGKPDEKAMFTANFAKAADGTAIHRYKTDKPAQPPIGEPVMYVAFRDNMIVFAGGDKGMDVIKKSLDMAKAPDATTSTALPQIEVLASVSKLPPLLPEKDQEVASDLSKKVFTGKDASHDKVRLTLKGEGDAVRVRLSSDLTVIKFFGGVGIQQKVAAPGQ